MRGHIRLNVGKYGSFAKAETPIDAVNTALDVSAVEYEREPRYRSGGYGGQREGGSRQFEFGTGGGSRGGNREHRDRGRRRF